MCDACLDQLGSDGYFKKEEFCDCDSAKQRQADTTCFCRLPVVCTPPFSLSLSFWPSLYEGLPNSHNAKQILRGNTQLQLAVVFLFCWFIKSTINVILSRLQSSCTSMLQSCNLCEHVHLAVWHHLCDHDHVMRVTLHVRSCPCCSFTWLVW